MIRLASGLVICSASSRASSALARQCLALSIRRGMTDIPHAMMQAPYHHLPNVIRSRRALRTGRAGRVHQALAHVSLGWANLPSPQDKAPDYPGLETCTDVSTPRSRRNAWRACSGRSSASGRNEDRRTRWQSDPQASPGLPRRTERVGYPSFHAAEPPTARRALREAQTEARAPGDHTMPWAPCSPRHVGNLRPGGDYIRQIR